MDNSHTYSIFIKCITTGKGGGGNRRETEEIMKGRKSEGRENGGERGGRISSKDEDNEEPNQYRLK